MPRNKNNDYHITCTTFNGRTNVNGNFQYSYEIIFNKSLKHSGRYEGIEKGLDLYAKWETSNFIVKWFIGLIMGFK